MDSHASNKWSNEKQATQEEEKKTYRKRTRTSQPKYNTEIVFVHNVMCSSLWKELLLLEMDANKNVDIYFYFAYIL